MNEIAIGARVKRPTFDEPIPNCAGTRGLTLLRSAPARELAATVQGEDRELLSAICRAVLRSMSPAEPMQVAVEYEALALHYPMMRRSVKENAVVQAAWLDALEGWPLDLIQEAARLWLNSAAERFPTPGQFKAPLADVLLYRQTLAKRASAFLQLSLEPR